MNNDKSPARLHILIARKSKMALVLRKGPSKQVCTFAWNRKEDSFQIGQWFKGRIYERRSDISPSGKHWIYFAANHKYHSETKGTWTAIAKVPYLKAITLFGKGDTWNGGGLFLDDKKYWLDDGYGHIELKSSSRITPNFDWNPKQRYGNECLTVYYNRLLRDGWKLTQKHIFEKKISKCLTLKKICNSGNPPQGQSIYWDQHELISTSGETITKPNWEWAEWVDNSIAYAENGCLYRVYIKNNNQLSEPKLIHDFNSYKFEAIKAPY